MLIQILNKPVTLLHPPHQQQSPLFVLSLCFSRQFICHGTIIVPDKEVQKSKRIKELKVQSKSDKTQQDESRFKWPLKLGVKSWSGMNVESLVMRRCHRMEQALNKLVAAQQDRQPQKNRCVSGSSR